MTQEIMTVGGGCFWCLEAVFEQLNGVSKVVSGYAGGRTTRPTYAEVCSGVTGHAEVISVAFDPAIIGYGELLRLFFAFHDPTTKDQQGPDVGTQYRSVIFPHSPAQATAAREVITALTAEGIFDDPIVTEVTPLGLDQVWPAEEKHQQYYRRNPDQMYCRFQVAPKVAKLRKHYAELIRSA